ncbi:MAG: Fic family protein [bacterium]|nr:Fic family protein [bacterium]
MFSPKYQITPKIVSDLSRIAEIKNFVETSKILPAREVFLRKMATIKMAHTSTSIEGNTLEEFEVKKLFEGKSIHASQKEILEVNNYHAALKLIDRLNKKSSFNISDILQIHKKVIDGLVSPQKIGVFRKTPVYIVNTRPNQSDEVVYTPPKAGAVEKEIKNLLAFLSKEKNLHPVLRAGLFHYQFESIHPFTDGNGRVGRLLTLLHLYQSGWGFKKILALEDYYNRDRKKYYAKLNTAATFDQRKTSVLTDWLEYFVAGFLDEAKNIKTQILTVPAVSGAKNVSLSDLELKIVDFAATVGKITLADALDITRANRRTVQRWLQRLVKNKILLARIEGPNSYYELNLS